jgi:hypothetical protein
MINETDVKIILKNLESGNETEFARMLFNFMQSGLVDQDRFRDIIIGARALAYDAGWDAAEEYAIHEQSPADPESPSLVYFNSYKV